MGWTFGQLAPSRRRPLVHASVPAWEYGLRISCSPFSHGEEISSVLLCSAAGDPPHHRYAALFLAFGIQLAGLFEHPTFSVGVVGWLIGGAMNLTRVVEYAVQTGRAWIVSFELLFPLTGLRATESGINCHVFGVVAIVVMLVSVVLRLAVAISGV